MWPFLFYLMILNTNNVAYIDGANLHKGVGNLGWDLDYGKFRVWLTEKYGVKKAYLFLGQIPKYRNLYEQLTHVGFTLVFKKVVYDSYGKVKGNCDADIVVHVMKDCYENAFEQAVFVASDGDYASLISFMIERNKLAVILSPAIAEKCSILLKRTGAKISYVNDQRSILQQTINEKAPDADETA